MACKTTKVAQCQDCLQKEIHCQYITMQLLYRSADDNRKFDAFKVGLIDLKKVGVMDDKQDVTFGCQPHLLKDLETENTRDNKELAADELAIFGFWRINKHNTMRCAQIIEIPYPIKREIYEHDSTSVNQVLFKGSSNNFFCFNKEYRKSKNEEFPGASR